MSAPPMADVCLILEGTYPYVRGGVSSWIHGLICGLPDLTFSLLAVSASRRSAAERKYELPANVVSFAEVFIHELVDDSGRRVSAAERSEAWELMRSYHRKTGDGRRAVASDLLRAASDPHRQSLSVRDAFYSREAWEFLLERYNENAAGTSFMDYFWTWRAVHAPLFQTLIAEVPPARVYHPISTGYAGLLASVAKLRTGRPVILTEHGIYVRERAIDIAQADWIYEEPVRLRVARPNANPLKEMWINFFVALGEIAYEAADEILTLFAGNQELQQELGADPGRSRVIPNGVIVDTYAGLRARRSAPGSRPPRVGFVGRVVPIKDVKTLIRACARVARQLPEAEFWIVGPTDENEEYFRECEELVSALGVEKLRFLGMRDVREIYPEIDVMVLTSISEGQPLTVIEAACAGVPTVATEVGACRELCEGRTEEDRALGKSGLITRVGDAEQTADAILAVLGDESLRRSLSEAGIARAERFYRQDQVLESYRGLYEHYRGL